MLKAAEACHKAKMTFGIGLGTTADSVDAAGALFAAFGAEIVNAKGDDHRQVGRGAPDAGIRPAVGEIPAGQRGQLRRRVQQPGVDLRAKRADLEPALGLGGGQARRAQGGRGLLDVPCTEGAGGALPAARRVLLGHLELQPEPVGGEGTDRVPVPARAGGGALQRGEWLRRAAVRQHDRLQGVGGCRTAEGHGLQLPDPQVARSGLAHGLLAGAARHRGADLQPRHHADDAGQAAERPVDQAGDGLGAGRAGGLRPLVDKNLTEPRAVGCSRWSSIWWAEAPDARTVSVGIRPPVSCP